MDESYSKIKVFLDSLPSFKNDKGIRYDTNCYEYIDLVWELQLWYILFTDSHLKKHIKNKMIKMQKNDPIFCYYIANNFDLIIDYIKTKICKDIDNDNDSYSFSCYNGYMAMYFKRVHKIQNIFADQLVCSNDGNPNYYSVKNIVQNNNDSIINRIFFELYAKKNPKTLKEMSSKLIYKKINDFFDELCDLPTQKENILNVCIHSLNNMVKLSNDINEIDKIYVHSIINANFNMIKNIIDPKNIINKWLNFINSLNLPPNIFDDIYMYGSARNEKNLINIMILLFKKVTFIERIGLIKTCIYDPTYLIKSDPNNYGLFIYKDYLDITYFRYVHDILKCTNLSDFALILRSLLELDDIIILKILFCMDDVFLNFICGFGCKNEKTIKYVIEIRERIIDDRIICEQIRKYIDGTIYVTNFKYDNETNNLRENVTK